MPGTATPKACVPAPQPRRPRALAPQPRRRRARLRCQASPRIAAGVAAAGRSMARSEEMPGPRRWPTRSRNPVARPRSPAVRRAQGAWHLLVRAGPSPFAMSLDRGRGNAWHRNPEGCLPGTATPKAACWHRNPEGGVPGCGARHRLESRRTLPLPAEAWRDPRRCQAPVAGPRAAEIRPRRRPRKPRMTQQKAARRRLSTNGERGLRPISAA
jgi:hypothetical protein